jgi:hypothetical protein
LIRPITARRLPNPHLSVARLKRRTFTLGEGLEDSGFQATQPVIPLFSEAFEPLPSSSELEGRPLAIDLLRSLGLTLGCVALAIAGAVFLARVGIYSPGQMQVMPASSPSPAEQSPAEQKQRPPMSPRHEQRQ